MKVDFKSAAVGAALLLGGCGDNTLAPDARDAAPPQGPPPSDVPIAGLSLADQAAFADGDALFAVTYGPADGLGPLYIRAACAACHAEGSRGPGFVQKMAVVQADGVTAAPDQSALPFGHTVREGLAAGATTPIVPPPGNPAVKVTVRVGPALLGRGYLEAIAESELARVEAAQAARPDAIHGRIQRVTYLSVPVPGDPFGTFTQGETNIVGRFGQKARQPTVSDFAADAFQGDMGLTSPMRPSELPNPDGLTDDAKAGVDLEQTVLDRLAFYLRRVAIPPRALPAGGAALFDQALCSACHVPALHTRADYPIAQLADIDAPVFTDLLLHDMGPALADGQTDQSADSFAWRTAPLVGERFAKAFLHDGRASTISAAIAAHDGEAAASRAAFRALSPSDQQLLADYVLAL